MNQTKKAPKTHPRRMIKKLPTIESQKSEGSHQKSTQNSSEVKGASDCSADRGRKMASPPPRMVVGHRVAPRILANPPLHPRPGLEPSPGLEGVGGEGEKG